MVINPTVEVLTARFIIEGYPGWQAREKAERIWWALKPHIIES